MAKVEIIDNFLDKKQFDYIHEAMTSAWFAWFYNDHITFDGGGEKFKKNHFQFTHAFYSRYQKSNQYVVIEPIVDKIDCIGLARIKAIIPSIIYSPYYFWYNFTTSYNFYFTTYFQS